MDALMKTTKATERVERRKAMRLDIRIFVDMDTLAGRSKTSATGDRNLQMEKGRTEGRTGQHSSSNNAAVATAEHVEGRTHQPSGSSSSSSGEGSSDVAMDGDEKKQQDNL